MREESQRSEDEWWNKGKMGRQRRQMLLGYAASLRILTTVCLAFSCYDIFFVARSHDLSGFLPFGLTEVGVQLTPHNNQWALELNSSKSRTGRPTPLQYKSHTRRESAQCLFSSKSNFFLHFLVLHFCGGVRSQSRPPPGLTLTHTHTQKTEHDTGTQRTICSSQYLWLQCVFRTFFHAQRELQAEREFIFLRKLRNFHLSWTPNKTRQGLLLSQYKEIWGKMGRNIGVDGKK